MNKLITNGDVASLKKANRNGALDLLKFIFAMMIVFHHTYKIDGISEENRIFLSGVEAIDFFFIVSGFLMAVSVSKNIKKDLNIGLGSETLAFIKSRILPILPYLFVGFLSSLLIRLIIQSDDFINSYTQLFNTVWEFLLLKMTGLNTTAVNPTTWYLSAMFIVMALLYPFLRRHFDLLSKVFCPLISVLIYGYIYMQYHSLRGSSSYWTGFAYKGTLRAAAGIMLGIGIFALCNAAKDIKLKPFFEWILSIVEWGGYALVFYMTYTEESNKFDYIIILIFAVSISITCSGKSALSKRIQGPVCSFLGKFSMVIYLCHYVFVFITPALFPDASYKFLIAAYVILSLLWSLIVMLGVTALQKAKLFSIIKDLVLVKNNSNSNSK